MAREMTAAAKHKKTIRSDPPPPPAGRTAVKRPEEKGRKMKDDGEASKRQRAKSPDSIPPPALGRDGKPMTTREASEMSPTPSSPLREPYIPESIYDTASAELFTAFKDCQAQFRAKSVRQAKMPTVQHFRPSCLFVDQKLLPIREAGTKAILSGARCVLGLSSYIDDEPLARCSGFWINWSEESKTGLVLTTTHLIRSKEPSLNQWLGKDEYSLNAKVTIHLLDDSTSEGHLIYFNGHYELALFSVKMDQIVQVPTFCDTVNCAQEVFRLGRDKNLNLKITHGRIEFSNPTVYERYHFMFLCHEDDESECDCDDEGGPIIDLDGKIVGITMNNKRGSFLPSSILLICLDMWWKFRIIPRFQFGLKLSSIKLLDPVHIESIWRKLKIDDGLIVDEVSKGSHAEKIGIRIGDVIECINGERISTTVELEKKCLIMCKDQYERGNIQEVNISILVYHPRRFLRRTRYLTARVSDSVEKVERDKYEVTAGCTSSAGVSDMDC